VPSFTFAATANSVASPVPRRSSPTSSPTPSASTRLGRGGDHRLAPSASCRSTSTATRPTWAAADLADRRGSSSSRTPRRPTARRWTAARRAFGQFAMFSLYPTKNMTSGEGGMVSVADAQTERMMRLYRNQGMERQYENEVVGFNTRMTDIHAAIGRVQLLKVDAGRPSGRRTPPSCRPTCRASRPAAGAPGAVHVYHQYTIRVPERGVGSGVYYPTPVHRLPSFDLDVDLPVTAQVAEEVISLPVHPSLTQEDLQAVVSAVNDVAGAGA
jgi:perosamine synthetase